MTTAKWGYLDTIESVPEPIGQVLRTYSQIPSEEQLKHVVAVRDTAYKAYKYPCLGRFRFLSLDLSQHPLYADHVLKPLHDSTEEVFLDLGTCLGQDIRKLIYDGARVDSLYGSDIEPAFIEAGYALFKDEEKFPKSHFLQPADVFDDKPDNVLAQLDDKVTILHATAVFHLFDKEQQEIVAERTLKLLRKQGRVLILGSQVGNLTAQETTRANGRDKAMRHSTESWKEMWEKTIRKDRWKDVVDSVTVDAQMTTGGKDKQGASVVGDQLESGIRWMVWSVWVDFK